MPFYIGIKLRIKIGLGGLFIAVVLLFPNGLAGLYQSYVAPRLGPLFSSKPKTRIETPTSSSAPVAPAAAE